MEQVGPVLERFERNKEKAFNLISKELDTLSSVDRINYYENFLKHWNQASLARDNCNILNNVIDLPSKKDQLFASLNLLESQNVVKIEIESYCLDCFLTYKDEPYTSYISNTKDVTFPELCPRCKGEGILHNIIINYPTGLHKLLMPETKWLQEIIIGYSLSKLDNVQKVFIHKKNTFYPTK